METRTVTLQKIQSWLKKYKNTKRHYWLHPSMLEYEANVTGAKIQPLNECMFNDDNETLVEAKKLYFSSPSFRRLPLVERKELVEKIGMPDSILECYRDKPSFSWLFESGKDLKSGESSIDDKVRGGEEYERTIKRTNTDDVSLQSR